MSLIWADNFEMYGDSVSPMLNGVYAEIGNFSNIEDSPAGFGKAFTVNFDYYARFVLPGPREKVGVASNIWLASLPTGNIRSFLYLVNSDNTTLFELRVTSTGTLQVWGSSVLLGETNTPVITANSLQHVEFCAEYLASDVTLEVRVRGRPVLVLEEIAKPVTLISQIRFGGVSQNSVKISYMNLVIWDGLGTVNNDFVGQVQVYWNTSLSTISDGGWSSSAGASVAETLNKPLWANQLTSSGNIVNSDTVRIDNTYYRWTSSAPTTGVGTSTNPWLVALGVNSAESLKNMYEAINASGIPGTTYSPDLVAHPLVKGFGLISDAFCVIPKVEGTTTMTFSETGAALDWTSTTTFLYRIWDPIRMSSGYTPAVKATGSLTFSGNPSDGDSVAVGGTTFTFKISPSAATDVEIGSTSEITAVNLASKISANLSTVVAEASSLRVDLTAVSAGALGNAISLASTSAVITTSDSTLEGGEDITYPDPFVVGLTPLPDDVTSIRAVIPVVRAAKLDGGDGNIQVSFGTLNTNYDVGPDTPITNAMTYWGNATEPFVSEINPDTGTPWTPGEFNLGARVRVARTK